MSVFRGSADDEPSLIEVCFDPTETLPRPTAIALDAGLCPIKVLVLAAKMPSHELGVDMRRREFIGLIGGVAAWPLAARAQQSTKLPTIGFMGAATPSGWSQWTAAFLQRLHELGWIEGRTVAIEYRWAEGRGERDAENAAEFVQLKVDVILTVDIGYTDCLRTGTRPAWAGAGRQSGAIRRQHYRPIAPSDRPCRQAPRTFARSCTPPPPTGGTG